MKGKELDIYIPSKNLAVEYDGGYAHKNTERDVVKDSICNQVGISIIRIREFDCPKINDSTGIYFCMTKDMWNSLDMAIKFIFDILNIKPDFSINNQTDKSKIYEFMDIQEQDNSLLKQNPKLAREWHPTLNGQLKPNEIICRAGKTVWWKCSKCRHEYQKKVVQKVLYPKCPKCQE